MIGSSYWKLMMPKGIRIGNCLPKWDTNAQVHISTKLTSIFLSIQPECMS